MPELREALEEAFGADEETGGPDEDTEDTVGSTETEEEPDGEPELESELEPVAEGEEGDGEDEEGEAGEGGGDEDELDETPADDEVKADSNVAVPVSWKPNAREHWAKLPPEVQQEVARREIEIQRTLSQSGEARNIAGAFMKAIQPYRAAIAAEGVDPITAVSNLMRVSSGLRTGTQEQKSLLISELMTMYGVDVETLDNTLVAKGSQEPDLGNVIDQKLQPIHQFINSFQQNNEQSGLDTQIGEFEKTHEFFNDVRADMADLVDMATARGEAITITDAYEKAVKLRPDLQSVLQARTTQAANKRKRRRKAASSLSGGKNSEVNTEEKPATLRGQLEAAWEGIK